MEPQTADGDAETDAEREHAPFVAWLSCPHCMDGGKVASLPNEPGYECVLCGATVGAAGDSE